MTKSKIRRCEAPGCRTLTASAYCALHDIEGPALAPRIDPGLDREAFAARVRSQLVEAAARRSELAAAQRAAKERDEAAAQRAEQRDTIEGLHLAAGRADRAGEQPVFAHV